MIEPEDIRRFERHIDFMVKAAGDDPAAFAQIVKLYDRLRAELPEAVAQLRRGGFSSSDIAYELGCSPFAVRKRFYRPTA